MAREKQRLKLQRAEEERQRLAEENQRKLQLLTKQWNPSQDDGQFVSCLCEQLGSRHSAGRILLRDCSTIQRAGPDSWSLFSGARNGPGAEEQEAEGGFFPRG